MGVRERDVALRSTLLDNLIPQFIEYAEQQLGA